MGARFLDSVFDVTDSVLEVRGGASEHEQLGRGGASDSVAEARTRWRSLGPPGGGKRGLAEAGKGLAEAGEGLAEARKGLAEAEKGLAEAGKALAEARKVLAEARKGLAEAGKALAEARKALAEARKSPAEALTSLAEARTTMSEPRTKRGVAETTHSVSDEPRPVARPPGRARRASHRVHVRQYLTYRGSRRSRTRFASASRCRRPSRGWGTERTGEATTLTRNLVSYVAAATMSTHAATRERTPVA